MKKVILIVSTKEDILKLSMNRFSPRMDNNSPFRDYPNYGSILLYLPEKHNLVNELRIRHKSSKRFSVFIVSGPHLNPHRESFDDDESSERILTFILNQSANSILLVNQEVLRILEKICTNEKIEIAILDWGSGKPTLL